MQFLKSLAESFYAPHFYSDLGHKKQGLGVAYIFIVSILSLLQFGVLLAQTDFFTSYTRFADHVRQLPTVTIKSGHLSIDKPVPYVFAFAPDMNVEVDTTYKSTDDKQLIDKLQHDKAFALIMSDSMVTYNGDGIQTQSFAGWNDQVITPQGWSDLAKWLEGGCGITLLIVTAIFMLGALFVVNFIITFLTALAVAFIGMFARSGLDFEGSFRVAAALRIPPNVLIFIPFVSGLVGWLIWAAYLIFAVVSCRVLPKDQAA